mmetsp:Transcript_7044/g.14658  ORF Transcript_7044/g.14658 Transcript_7044/m.14658 type:complete len:310 (-) Transcript_7044:87-1016(-)
MVELLLIPRVPTGGLELLGRLQERIRDHERNGLLHLQGRDLGQLRAGLAEHGWPRCEVCVGEEVELVDELREERLGLGLLLVHLGVGLRSVAQHLRLILLRINVSQAHTALLKVQRLHRVLLGTLRPLRGRQRRLADDVVKGLVPDALPDNGVHVELWSLQERVGTRNVLQGLLARRLLATCTGGLILGASRCEVGHGLVQVHLQQRVQGALLGGDLAAQAPGLGFELLLLKLRNLLFEGSQALVHLVEGLGLFARLLVTCFAVLLVLILAVLVALLIALLLVLLVLLPRTCILGLELPDLLLQLLLLI